MNVEGLVILRMLDPERVSKFLKLTDRHFRRYKDEYKFIVDYYARYGSVPGIDLFSAKFPNFFLEVKDADVEDEYLIDYLEEARIHEVIRSNLDGVVAYLNLAKPKKAYDKLVDIVNECRLSFVTSYVRNIREVLTDLVEDYSRTKSGELGVDFIINELNEAIGGVRRGEVFILASRPGVGKTWFLLMNAYNLWTFGHKVLFITPEMSSVGVARRFISIHTGLNATKIRKAYLNFEEEARLLNEINSFNDDRFHIMADAGSFTFSDVEAALMDVKPTVVFVDGAYLIKPSWYVSGEYWVMAKAVADWLSRVAKNYNVPVIASTQLHRISDKGVEEVGLEDLAYSDAFSQNADFVSYFYSVKFDDVFNKTRYRWVTLLKGKWEDKFHYYRFKLLKAREGRFGVDVYIGIDYSNLLFFDVGRVDGGSKNFSLIRFGDRKGESELERVLTSLAESIEFGAQSSSQSEYPF